MSKYDPSEAIPAADVPQSGGRPPVSRHPLLTGIVHDDLPITPLTNIALFEGHNAPSTLDCGSVCCGDSADSVLFHEKSGILMPSSVSSLWPSIPATLLIATFVWQVVGLLSLVLSLTTMLPGILHLGMLSFMGVIKFCSSLVFPTFLALSVSPRDCLLPFLPAVVYPM